MLDTKLSRLGLPIVNAPKPLLFAAAIGVLEAVVLVVLGVLELLNLSSERLAMGLTTAGFFFLVAAALVACAFGLAHLKSIARSPLVLAQLIALGVASSFLGMPVVALTIAAFAVACLVGIFHPASIEALEPM